jgi:hypothetical protein
LKRVAPTHFWFCGMSCVWMKRLKNIIRYGVVRISLTKMRPTILMRRCRVFYSVRVREHNWLNCSCTKEEANMYVRLKNAVWNLVLWSPGSKSNNLLCSARQRNNVVLRRHSALFIFCLCERTTRFQICSFI